MMKTDDAADSHYTTEYFKNETICRLCLSTGAESFIIIPEGTKISNEKPIFKSENSITDIPTKVMDTLGCQFVEYKDNFPKRICPVCIFKVDAYHEFKSMCERSNTKLIQVLSDPLPKLEVKVEINEYSNSDAEIEGEANIEGIKSECEKPHKNAKIRTKKKNVTQKNIQSLDMKPGTRGASTYCNICYKDYGPDFTEHNREAHGIEGSLYRCYGCERQFTKRTSRLAHECITCKHLANGYPCRTCGALLPSRRTMEAHNRCHREGLAPPEVKPPLRCSGCERTFKSKAGLAMHLEACVKFTERKYICEVCGRVFARKDYLRIHMHTHTGAKLYVCPHCGFRSRQKSSLNIHIRRHTGERPFSCDVCSQRCISSSNLLAHKRRHEGIKKYHCTLCDKRFGYKTSLEEHIKCSHERLKSHCCNVCGAAYMRKKGLKNHMKSQHGITLHAENAQ